MDFFNRLLGDAWHEAGKKPLTWPVLAGDDERWAIRAEQWRPRT